MRTAEEYVVLQELQSERRRDNKIRKMRRRKMKTEGKGEGSGEGSVAVLTESTHKTQGQQGLMLALIVRRGHH